MRSAFRSVGVAVARRATPADATEEVFLVTPNEYRRLNHREVIRMLMAALPHRKVGLAPMSPGWDGEEV